MLEPMDVFFDRRLDGYEAHQLTAIASAQEFYPFTASLLPVQPGARILDLGCGTGLELDFYFPRNPTARVTGIDLAPGMLQALREKFAGRALTLIQGSYFDVPLDAHSFDAAVSVESLHHFTLEEKIPLYRNVCQGLVPGGFLILTDYFAQSEAEEAHFRQALLREKAAQGLSDSTLYHFDTPLTVEHEMQALREGGFSRLELLGRWGATCTIRAYSGRGSL